MLEPLTRASTDTLEVSAVNPIVTPYDERMTALRARLMAALDPQTEQERSIVEWLGGWDEPTLEPLATMLERVRADREAVR